MGDSRPLPGFGQVDLDIEDEPASGSAFGELDWDLGDDGPAEPGPPSAVRGSQAEHHTPEHHTKVTRRNLPAAGATSPAPPTATPTARPSARSSVHDESTRIVQGDALSNITRPPPPVRRPSDGATRAFADVELEARGTYDRREEAADAPRSRTGAQPSESGVATRDARVAAMRELYARGDADGALALATMLDAPHGGGGGDHPDASVVLELGEEEISDPFGGLIPVDDDLAARPTVAPPASPVLATPAPAAPVLLSLTERHSIPRLLKSMSEVSKLPIDHRAGFLLAHVDGMQTLEEILDICAMPPVEALDLISNLREMGVIEFE